MLALDCMISYEKASWGGVGIGRNENKSKINEDLQYYETERLRLVNDIQRLDKE